MSESTQDEELQARRERLLLRKETIDGELRDARHEMSMIAERARSRRLYASAGEYNALDERIRTLGAESQSVQRQIGIIRERIKQVGRLAQREDKLTFEAIAREMLDAETFMAIQREVAFRRNIVTNAPRRNQEVGSALPVHGGASGFRRR